MRFFKKQRNKNETHDAKKLKKVMNRELRENREVLESLRDYDAGKKDISTRDIERRVRDIQRSS
jgi:hypothetical protein